MKKTFSDTYVWRDISDPRRAQTVDDLEAGLKSPDFENLSIPETFGPVKEIIDDHKIKRYAFALNDYLPWAMQGNSPFDNTRIAQAGLLTNDLLQMFTLGYRGSQVVGLHTEEQIWFDSPAKLDEIVTLEGTYVDAYEHRGQGCVVLEANAKGADGRSIIRHRGVEILRTIPGNIVGRGSAAPEKRVTGNLPPNPHYIDTITSSSKIGDCLTPLSKNITAEQAAVFSRVGEFVTNIHNNLSTARAGGLRMPIVQGMQSFCTFTELLTRAFGKDFFTGGWIKAKFIAPITVFEDFNVYGIITNIEKVSDTQEKVYLDVWIRRQDDRLAVAGWASCLRNTSDD